MIVGRVVKAWSNWYDVVTAEGRLTCQARGKLRLETGGVRVGDEVQVYPIGGGEGRIDAVQPRRTQLDRPPVANVDQAVIVTSWVLPPWNAEFVDRCLVATHAAGLVTLLVLNKVDLLDQVALASARATLEPYAVAGYEVLYTSALKADGLERLRSRLEKRLTVLAGPSGVGKSSLLAALLPGATLRSGEVSAHLGRGRHTTRHVELLAIDGGWVADTPGFSRLDVAVMEPAALGTHLPEIAARAAHCRFRGCLHRSEPGCAVRGAIDPSRYARYLRLLEECEARQARRW